MRHVLFATHLLGFVLWMGGGIAAGTIGFAMGRAPRSVLGVMAGLLGRLHQRMILPGALLTVLSGLLLTLSLYGSATSVSGYPVPLMVMQGAGLVGAAIVLIVNFPAVSRLTRLDPAGEHGALFDALLRRASLSGALTGVFAVIALLGGAWLR